MPKPPFASTTLASQDRNRKPTNPNIVTLNVGGQLFQTTPQTLSLAGPTSLLSSNPPSFIDRDPNLFSLLLSFLRTNRFPSNSSNYSVTDLVAEAQFYGLDPSLFSSNLSHFDAFDLQRSRIIPLSGRDSPSAIATDDSGALHVAHGGKITSFDWSLSNKSTVLTRLPAVDSLLAIDRSVVAAGAVDFPGLQILDLSAGGGSGSGPGPLKKTLSWNAIGSASAVQATGSSPDYLFGSFESIRRNSSAIVAFDRASFTQVAEIGRKEIYGADLDSAIPATKLMWVSGVHLLLATGSHAGPSGLTGNIRLWDVRSNNNGINVPVWELTEKVDCFADVAVLDTAMFKVGVNSGDVFMMDLRKLGEEWNCLGKKIGGFGNGGGGKNGNLREGSGCLVESHGGKVFVSRGGELEVWSEVLMGNGMGKNEDGVGDGERVLRRNLMGRREDFGGKRIVKLGFGGRRMVVVRKEEQFVEVWESSSSSRFC